MALRKIRLSTDEVLRKKSKEVKEINDKILELLDDMADTMYDSNGVGLAAPQIGILRRVIIVDIGNGLIELINPVILETAGEQFGEEGCLSVPGKIGDVRRPDYCKVEALNRKGEKIIVEGNGLMARALCHEIDHLEGILYIDKVEDGTLEEVEEEASEEVES